MISKKAAFYIAACILVLFAVIAGAAYLSTQKHSQLQAVWDNFYNQPALKGKLIAQIERELGFVGFIHNFKNYILRQDSMYADQAAESFNRVLILLEQYENLDLTDDEKIALSTLGNTFTEYAEKLEIARDLAAKGFSPTEIDSRVKVNDLPASAAVKSLRAAWLLKYENSADNMNAYILGVEHVTRIQITVGVVLALVICLIALWLLASLRKGDQLSNELMQNRDRFIDFAKASSDWFWEMDPDLKFSYFAPHFQETTGFGVDHMIGKSRRECVDTNLVQLDYAKWEEHEADLLARRPFKDFEYEFVTRDGRHLHVRVSGVPVFDANGNFQGYRGSGADITHMIESEKSLRASEEQFRAFIDNLPSFINLKDSSGRYLLINKKHSEIFDIKQDGVIGKVMSDFLPKHYVDDAQIQVREVRETKASVTRERRIYIHKKPRDFLVTKFPIFDESGNVARIGTIGTDISKLKETQKLLIAANAEADKAKREAEEANHSKSDFLAAMSHDLRTPLNAIIGFSEAIHLQYFGPINVKYQEYASDIRLSGEHLLALIGDILDVSAIEAGKLSVQKENISIADVAIECETIVKTEAEKNAVELSLDISDDKSMLYADRQAIKKIILNLLSNAIKYTPQGGRISLVIQNEDMDVVIKVQDTGKGIPEEQISKITNPFVRWPGNPHISHGGAGLGLAIVQSLVQQHEGQLEIHSTLGVGTTVSVRLPFANPAWESLNGGDMS